jgi:hypothetical protein
MQCDRNYADERESAMTRRTVVLMAGVLVAVTACSNDGTAGGPSGGSTSSAASSAGGAPPQCVVGRWNATGVDARGSVGNATGNLSGGSGTMMNVGADGVTQVSFAGSQPLVFSAQVAGRDVRGQASYDGTVRGAMQIGPQDNAGKGTWTPQGTVTWDDLRATVKLTEPVSVTLLDNANISDLTGDKSAQAGGAVDVQPILRAGTYTCAGDTLQVRTEDNGPAMEWTFKRA